MSIPSKVLTRILLEIPKAAFREEQAGFRAGSSCIDQI